MKHALPSHLVWVAILLLWVFVLFALLTFSPASAGIHTEYQGMAPVCAIFSSIGTCKIR